MLKQLSLSCKIYYCFSLDVQLLVSDSLNKSSQQPIGTQAKQIKHFVWKRKSPNFCKQKINCNFIFISFCISIWFGNDSHIRLKVLRKIKVSLFFIFDLELARWGSIIISNNFWKPSGAILKLPLIEEFRMTWHHIFNAWSAHWSAINLVSGNFQHESS